LISPSNKNDKATLQELADSASNYYLKGDFAAAIKAYSEIASAYVAAGNFPMASEMQNNQSVVLLRNKQAQAAFDAAKGTDLVFAEIGDTRRQGIALANQASALQALRRNKEAIDFYIKSGEAFEIAGEMDLRFQVMKLLSSFYLRNFRFFDAILALQSGLAPVKNPTLLQRVMKKFLFFRL
jgi:tetratricopeptide (TPR) repeat protein